MISHLKNNDGCIVAYIEWFVLNPALIHDDNGEYLWVQDLWIHEKLRGKGVLQYLMNEVALNKFTNKVKFIRWRRDKYKRLSKTHTVERFLKYIGEKNG